MALRIRTLAAPALAAIVVGALALLLRSPSSTPAMATGAGHTVRSGHVTVRITNFAFVPSRLTVRAGTHITFVNDDATAHTATALNRAFDTGAIQPQKRATITVAAPGNYPYDCLFHAFMTGTVRVVR